MNGYADVLGAAEGASKQGHQTIVHSPMIRPELVAESMQIEFGALTVTDGVMAVNHNALATVYAFPEWWTSAQFRPRKFLRQIMAYDIVF